MHKLVQKLQKLSTAKYGRPTECLEVPTENLKLPATRVVGHKIAN